MELQERIRYVRKNILKMTQTEFANELKTTRSVINNLEQGCIKRLDQKESFLMLICQKYGINQKWLIYGEGEPEDAVEDAASAYVEALLGDEENPLYDIIRSIMKVYVESGEPEQKIIREFAERLRSEMQNKG